MALIGFQYHDLVSHLVTLLLMQLQLGLEIRNPFCRHFLLTLKFTAAFPTFKTRRLFEQTSVS
ncbi:hypothetical protein AALP_AA6G169600 [Arabis alpina]|uniref:Uncharacterized protein n=1 Tax=Arabis alpina TaxID=50452 RepID=A0A087GPS1_ARAAL|nr:hypothetical protein AALP_AA6G169600 [Arabis alpina]